MHCYIALNLTYNSFLQNCFVSSLANVLCKLKANFQKLIEYCGQILFKIKTWKYANIVFETIYSASKTDQRNQSTIGHSLKHVF